MIGSRFAATVALTACLGCTDTRSQSQKIYDASLTIDDCRIVDAGYRNRRGDFVVLSCEDSPHIPHLYFFQDLSRVRNGFVIGKSVTGYFKTGAYIGRENDVESSVPFKELFVIIKK